MKVWRREYLIRDGVRLESVSADGRESILVCMSGVLVPDGAVQDLSLPFSQTLDSTEFVVTNSGLEPSRRLQGRNPGCGQRHCRQG